jgi:hypothetical protein
LMRSRIELERSSFEGSAQADAWRGNHVTKGRPR